MTSKPSAKRPRTAKSIIEEVKETPSTNVKPLVFISHDTRDADLAEAFNILLTDVSAGTLKAFRSSDKKGNSGIEFGAEWYGAIMSQLDNATNVVALLTHRSIERPWILYEAGVAKGKLDTTVLGLALGVPLSDVSTGPFGQFQNCGDDEDSLTKLVMQLLQCNPDAAPREEAVRSQVKIFIAKKNEILSTIKAHPKKKIEAEESSTAKLFEEIKVMIRNINTGPRISNISYQNKMSRKLPPMLLESIMMEVREYPSKDRAAILLIVASLLRDDIPWLYEPVIEFYRAITRGSAEEMNMAHEQLRRVLSIISHGPFEKYLFRIDEDGMYRMKEIFNILDMSLMEFGTRPTSRGRNKA